ncbi:lipoyl(octanoyl) transferase LipB [Moritella viscosa]|uniref:Octanoyltransferase n=1 Tax=Moritella viscosa TaxID=80854 RepID=A0ABY1HBN4_9GAMM|nr:lipoyl(octanoyl) transferase LipB [Moritella viscosa]SGY82724.1 Octanoyltransferase-Lipoate-protein ligase B-Lipoyl/octanoyl transferase-Octanoyl-[acyl-carrier-protein]-protein N-octanoyltransferase [Moritella viscosa]SGY83638.1 Octanoyltransferase-Lipoate-protein ligase B-Lipoyl/octanoyl transferase-Octanoyl-[acyl-carrier-protein]-protein N-octanoyltransferase [Moritella viscosa]SHO24256.1 Octanoyltransferase-Lipoate-protein ligase B-Lipoyl/octanoyl transferase-Octanoyl-[acyl-carrier-protein
MSEHSIIIRQLNRQSYTTVFDAMKSFTDNRDDNTEDELWFVEHDPVFTQGQAGKVEHILATGDIPVVQADRGGQVTYHGPGQQVVYFLLDIKRRKLGVRDLVSHIENGIIATLAETGIEAYPRADAPGVYVADKKVASLGLRIRKGRSFHGLALNINMDLSPFLRINPCGYAGMEMTQTSDLGGATSLGEIQPKLVEHLCSLLEYTQLTFKDGLTEHE